MKKVAFVVQRYGLEVNGGAEQHCRQLAEELQRIGNYNVEVISTKAIDYVTWKNEYKSDEEWVNGILVRRFATDKQRNNKKFQKISSIVLQGKSSRKEEVQWMKEQGPYSSELLKFIEQNKNVYDVFIFFTYLYCTTWFGLPLVSNKAILIPTAHDELPIYLGIFKELFSLPKGIFYNTLEEKLFVEKKFKNEFILNNNGCGGVGVKVPEVVSASDFTKKYGLDEFMLYIGRIDEHKGCSILFKYFMEYQKRNANDLKLVLMGKEVINIPKADNLVSLGFVSDEDKFNGLEACKLLVLPSQFESLSMVVLEAMKMNTPVLVNGKCEVLRQHCIKSNAGLYYNNYLEFEEGLNYLLSHKEECEQMGTNGQQYVEQNYQWDVIIARLSDMIDQIILLQKRS